VMQTLEHASGNYARRTQFQERASGDQRDLAQAQISREMCEKHQELVAVVDRHNAGPSH